MNPQGKSEAGLWASSRTIQRATVRARLHPGPCAAFVAAFFLWFSAAGAEAHSVYIFAYLENSQICTNSYFGGKGKVIGGRVSMAAASGKILATAQTDEQGNACFAPPESSQDLFFTVEAGEGHQAEFKLPASDIDGAFESNQEPVDQSEEAASGSSAVPATGGLTRDDLRQALSPIMRKLAEMESAQNSRVNFKDIIGGLGWIIGLAGAALWAVNRKNRG
jgi:nickel transport protein